MQVYSRTATGTCSGDSVTTILESQIIRRVQLHDSNNAHNSLSVHPSDLPATVGQSQVVRPSVVRRCTQNAAAAAAASGMQSRRMAVSAAAAAGLEMRCALAPKKLCYCK